MKNHHTQLEKNGALVYLTVTGLRVYVCVCASVQLSVSLQRPVFYVHLLGMSPVYSHPSNPPASPVLTPSPFCRLLITKANCYLFPTMHLQPWPGPELTPISATANPGDLHSHMVPLMSVQVLSGL